MPRILRVRPKGRDGEGGRRGRGRGRGFLSSDEFFARRARKADLARAALVLQARLDALEDLRWGRQQLLEAYVFRYAQ